jgi:hypothetical protein
MCSSRVGSVPVGASRMVIGVLGPSCEVFSIASTRDVATTTYQYSNTLPVRCAPQHHRDLASRIAKSLALAAVA